MSDAKLDVYVRFLAASLAVSPTTGQFVGRKKLPDICARNLQNVFITSSLGYSNQQILNRLQDMLDAKMGLAWELDVAIKDGTLELIQLPYFEELQKALETGESVVRWNTGSEQSFGLTLESPPPYEPSKYLWSTSSESRPPTPPDDDTQIPFPVQHLLLPSIQSLLERSCYRYLSEYHPHMKTWSSPESVELNKYVQLLQTILVLDADDKEDFRMLITLRHIAVHRSALTTVKFIAILDAAAGVALRHLGDLPTAGIIWKLKELAMHALEEQQKISDASTGLQQAMARKEKMMSNVEEKMRVVREKIRKIDKERLELYEQLDELRSRKTATKDLENQLAAMQDENEKAPQRLMRMLREKIEDILDGEGDEWL